MGAAIAVFDNAKAVVIERDRFVPVKKTNDLLALLSDAYVLGKDYKLKLSEHLQTSPTIALDTGFYKTLDQFYHHFKEIPSLKKCAEFTVEGEVFFKEKLTIEGKVSIIASQPTEITKTKLKNTKIEI
jgi:UTP--glucose-1-phosphate uridylyltransferase